MRGSCRRGGPCSRQNRSGRHGRKWTGPSELGALCLAQDLELDTAVEDH